VRPEYEALAHDFRALAAPFHLAVDESLERDLVLVAASFEAIDRHGDATPDGEDRMLLGAAILRACEQPWRLVVWGARYVLPGGASRESPGAASQVTSASMTRR